MAISYNLKLPTDGIIFYLDAANARSYAGTGLTAFDLTNSSFRGTFINGTGFSSSNNGTFTFDGTNDSIAFQPNSKFEFGTGNFTVIAWHKKPNFSIATIVHIDDGNGTGIILYTVVDGSFFNWVAGTFKAGTINVSDNTWKQVALVRSSGVCQQYVNALPDQSFTASGSVVTSGRSLTLGENTGTYFHNGSISQILIYNRALSAAEIRQLYNATKGRYGL